MGAAQSPRPPFPFLFGGAFIEAFSVVLEPAARAEFPFLLGGAFIEARGGSFSSADASHISLLFRRDFH